MVRLAEERQQMVFAARGEFDVLHQYHFVVLLGERFLKVDGRVGAEAGEHFGVHAGDAFGRVEQPFAVWVFADGGEQFAHRPPQPWMVHGQRGQVVRRRKWSVVVAGGQGTSPAKGGFSDTFYTPAAFGHARASPGGREIG